MSTPDLTIAVLHYNRWDLTKDCIASIDSQDIPCTYEKLLVDNGSKIPVTIHQLPSEWKLFRAESNNGHITGQNLCFEQAQGEWVLFVANDVRFLPSSIHNLWLKKRDISHPTLWNVHRELDNRGLLWVWPGYGVSTECDRPGNLLYSFTGSCYLMHKNIWNIVGKLDEFLRTSHEDIDFSIRAERMGLVITGIRDSHAIHLGNATLKHQPSHNRSAFHKDRVYVIKKHYRGVGRFLRLTVVTLLDAIPRF